MEDLCIVLSVTNWKDMENQKDRDMEYIKTELIYLTYLEYHIQQWKI